jgi:hypothetical protein
MQNLRFSTAERALTKIHFINDWNYNVSFIILPVKVPVIFFAQLVTQVVYCCVNGFVYGYCSVERQALIQFEIEI